MKNCPKVSICIPAYKQTEYLSNTLDSILIQEYQNFEVIISDDSPDDSVEDLVKEYDFKGRLKYSRNKDRKGTPANWDEAINLASGEYMKLMHHDDWFVNEKCLQKYVSLLDDNPKADFAFSGRNIINQNSVISRFITSENVIALKENPYTLILGNIIGSPSATIYRRGARENFDTKLKWLVDLDQYIRMLEKNPYFVSITEPLINQCNKGIHQVTNECQNNVNVALPEYIYVYNKYTGKFKLDKTHKNFIQNVLVKYNIRNINDLKSLSLLSDIPKVFEEALSGSGSIKLRVLEIDKVLSKILRRIRALKFAGFFSK